jgi:murein DD-endopeptidase MepM/ murein hydrolase activator NlpD
MAGVSAARGAAVSLTIRWAGRPRTLALRPWAGVLLLVVLPLVAAWCCCASLYFVFHDDLLAALIARQTATQYAYEDRIATLKAELETTTGDLSSNQDTARGALGELRARAARLEARAAALDAVVSKLGLEPAATAVPAPLAPRLRLGSIEDAGPHATTIKLAEAEAAQDRAAQGLREPVLRRIMRVRTALAETGLPATHWQAGAEDGVGGPFVPLDHEVGFSASLDMLRDAAAQAAKLDAAVDRIPLRRPLEGPLEVTSPFGPRLDPFFGRAAMHTGIDLREDSGDAVTATAAGTVVIAGRDGGYGNMVEVDHGGGLATRYAHLSLVEVAVGQRVKPGQIVGRVGATGRATGPHLHYETRIDGVPVDPARFLKAAAILSPDH